jgi:hypothetical protein
MSLRTSERGWLQKLQTALDEGRAINEGNAAGAIPTRNHDCSDPAAISLRDSTTASTNP